LLLIIPVVVGLILVSIFMPAQQVSIEGIGTLSFETKVTLSVGSEAAYASPDALPGWTYRRAIDLSPATSIADYQVLVTLNTSSMGNPYANVKADGSDIRFTASDGTTLQDYWVESWDSSGTSKIWVEVTAPVTSTLYMYYGNAAAGSASDGDATFVFFDDFSDGTLDKWKYLTGASVVTDDTQPSQFGTYAMDLNAGTNHVKCNTALMQDAGIRVLMKDLGTGGSGSPDADGVVGLRGSDSNTYDGILVEHDTDTGFHFDTGAAGSVPGDYITFDVWEWQEFVAYGTIPSDHQAKHWEYGAAEPSTYSLKATSVSVTAAGLPFVRVASGEAHISVVAVRKYVNPEPSATVGGEEPDIVNDPSSKDFGTVFASSSYWSKGSAPDWSDGLGAGECFFAVTNNSSDAVDISIIATDFSSGGVWWTLVSGSPGENEVIMKVGKEGDGGEGDMVTLSTTINEPFISGLAISESKAWELKLETGTFTDSVQKTSIITLTATFA